MARDRRTRINGPYAHRSRWRVFVIRPDGSRDARSYASKEEAEALIASLERQLAGETTIAAAIKRYLEWLERRGVRPVTVTNAERFLHLYFGGAARGQLRSIAPSRAQRLYDALLTRKHRRGTGYSAATHRASLTEVKRFMGWCVKQRLIKNSPVAGIEPVGRKNRGKEQLRGDEARKLLDYCLAAYGNGNQHALIPLLCLGLALRASEVCGLDARDVDDGGATLWITRSKTEAGKRRLEVAGPIAACLAHQARGRLGQLIPGATPASVYHHVVRICARAGVTVVCPHGLRGTHATLAASKGATSALLMEALGHTSIAVTRAHYIQTGTMEGAQAKEAMRQLVDVVATEEESE